LGQVSLFSRNRLGEVGCSYVGFHAIADIFWIVVVSTMEDLVKGPRKQQIRPGQIV
jgi:hypothetical protein